MHLTRGPCFVCQQEGQVVCLACGLGLQLCRPCVEALLAQFPPRTLQIGVGDAVAELGGPPCP